jgi:HK97 family phage prohead protease
MTLATWRETRKSIKADVSDAGQVAAVVSVFDVVDTDGDVVRASAFTDGQEVPMVWAHDWAHPVGKGVIRVGQGQAVFDGSFFMDTTAGAEAYRTVKAMGGLQEWSWGFRVLESDIAPPPDGMEAPKTWHLPDGKVQYITKTEVFEVSPVLVGANRQTQTLDIKAQREDAERIKAADALQAFLNDPTADNADAAITALQELRSEHITDSDSGGKQPDWTTTARQAIAAAALADLTDERLSDCA